jgi:hypothetical protein
MILVLSAMRAYAIVNGDYPEPQHLALDHNDNCEDCKAYEAEAPSMIRLSCSPNVRCIVKGMRNPDNKWNTLESSLDTAISYISRHDILRQAQACRPN